VTAVVAATLALVAFGATGLALIRDPVRQAIMLSFFGLALAVLFLVFQAPDVALSEIAVGSMVLPLLILLAVSKTRGRRL
jgi:energy-converting hydrogenase B subunit D